MLSCDLSALDYALNATGFKTLIRICVARFDLYVSGVDYIGFIITVDI